LPLPKKLQRCVVFFGEAPDNSVAFPQLCSKYRGTGFVVSVPCLDGRFAHNYLVTNAHVADVLETSPNAFVRVNKAAGPADEIWLGRQKWTRHPRTEVDIAILRPDFRKFPAWGHTSVDAVGVDEFIPPALLDDVKMGVGDPIHVSGLLHSTPGVSRNMPLVRSGTLAALADEPLQVRPGVFEPAHLGVILSVGGMSGSPTFIEFRPPPFATTPSQRPWGYLLGVNAGHFAGLIDGGSNTTNAGVNVIYPAERLGEILNLPEVLQEQRLFEDALRKAYPEQFGDEDTND
jgi:hypothetical protein